MKSALSLTLVGSLVASALPVTAQAQMERPGSIDLRGPATLATAGPLASAMRREAVRLAVADLTVDAPGRDARGRSQSSDDAAWSRVQGLSASDEVRVVLGSDASSDGRFRIADAGSITLLVAGREQKTMRVDVRRVSIVRDTDRWQHVVLGLVIGGAIGGVAAGLHCRGQSPSCKEVAPAYVAPGVGAGAGIGALLPKRRVWQEIYAPPGAHRVP